jgi:hypothetical protein
LFATTNHLKNDCPSRKLQSTLLKLGIDIGETSVSKYMLRRRKPPSQTRRVFLETHVKSLVLVDFFTVPDDPLSGSVRVLVLAHDPGTHAESLPRPAAEAWACCFVPQVGGLQHRYERRAA